MRLDSPDLLLQEAVRNLYSAENQLILTLPRVAARVCDSQLRSALEAHLDETRTHAARLKEIAGELGFSIGGATSLGMKGLLQEGEEALGYGGDPGLVDSAIIGACQKVEHYEIAAYGTALALAERLGLSEAAAILQTTLDEEGAADKKLTKLAKAGTSVASNAIEDDAS